MYYSLPTSFDKALPIIQRAMHESAASVLPLASNNRRPNPPRSLSSSAGTGQALVTWLPPARKNDVAGWRVYRDNESNLYASISDPATLQVEVALPSGGAGTYIYVSAINSQGRESIKVQVRAKSDSNQYVAAGTAGAASGGIGSLPPDYINEIAWKLAQYGYYL